MLLAPSLSAQAVSAADSLFANRRWAPALEGYEKALVEQPASLTVHVKAGYAALKLGRVDQAARHFRVVVDAKPANGAPAATAGLAAVTARRGDRDRALALLEQAVLAGYANVEELDQEAAYRSIRKDARFATLRARAERSAYPCLADSTARAFDFWLGEWDVYVTGTAQRAGTNRITRISGGCAILESWTAWATPLGAPSEGTSLNFVDPATGLWRQVWMGSGRSQNNYEHGRFADGAMRFDYRRTDARATRPPGGSPSSLWARTGSASSRNRPRTAAPPIRRCTTSPTSAGAAARIRSRGSRAGDRSI